LVISMAGAGASVNNEDTTDTDIVASSPADPESIVAGDFDEVGSTVFSSLALSAFTGTAGTYNAFPGLSQAGIDEINGSGFTTYAFRNSRDTDNAAPPGYNRMRMRAVNVGTTKPKMVVEHEAGVTDTGFLLMF